MSTYGQDSMSAWKPRRFKPNARQRRDLERTRQQTEASNMEWLHKVAKEQTSRGARAREILAEMAVEEGERQ